MSSISLRNILKVVGLLFLAKRIIKYIQSRIMQIPLKRYVYTAAPSRIPIVSELWVYPIKSLGGFNAKEVEVTQSGFKFDRRWVIYDTKESRFISQRKYPCLALLKAELWEEGNKVKGVKISKKNSPESFVTIPIDESVNFGKGLTIWDVDFRAEFLFDQGDDASNFVSEYINSQTKKKREFRLLYLGEKSTSKCVEKYRSVSSENLVAFSDGFPFLLGNENSLIMLNNHLLKKYNLKHVEGIFKHVFGFYFDKKNKGLQLEMDRFRPNIVVRGFPPFKEERVRKISFNGVDFEAVKPSSRCKMTKINQTTAQVNKTEPLSSLRELKIYQGKENTPTEKVYFGQNLVLDTNSTGKILKVGDILCLEE
eukprot:maker-scaffold_50-snap-gene-0.0-mRNA-1 protein AED:0.00 eAED:0.00 QI:327/1/1/1/1/1/2/863/366